VGRYKSAKQQREEAQTRSAYAKIAGVAVAFAVLIGIYVTTIANRPTLDADTQCPASPESMTVLLVDVTDPLNVPQRQDFINQLERLRSTIPQYGKLAIFKVDPLSDQLLKPVIERCNPGTADDVSEYTGNKEAASKRWEKGFMAPLDEAFTQIMGASDAPQSPVLESIQSVALTQMKKQAADGKKRKLIIASDLLQNTARMSFYSGLPTPESALASDAFRMLRTDLNGIDIELWMLQRPDSKERQPAQLRQVWEAMISEMGGKIVRIYNVSG
jgi:hypothetical protein